MRVAVLGAGVTGICTAYYLAELGHSVTVYDREAEVAAGASAGNGGQLSYSYTDAFAGPGLLRKLPGQVLGLDPSFRFRPPLNAGLARWGLAVLGECSARKARQNTESVLKTAMRSASLMTELREKVGIDFSFRKAGKLVLLSSDGDLESAQRSLALKHAHGCKVKIVTFEEACDIEPALVHFQRNAIAAVWAEDDEVGNSREFCQKLGDWLVANRDVRFRLQQAVNRITINGRKRAAIHTSGGLDEPDATVVCLGAGSPRLLSPLGIEAGIYPVRGYSVTLPAGPDANRTSVTDLKSKVVFSRLGDRIRIAGLVDFVGHRTHRDESRVRDLVTLARKLAPNVARYDQQDQSGWGGFRPLRPDSRPLVGQSRVGSLFLNTGHGMLGWTLACATSNEVARQVDRAG